MGQLFVLIAVSKARWMGAQPAKLNGGEQSGAPPPLIGKIDEKQITNLTRIGIGSDFSIEKGVLNGESVLVRRMTVPYSDEQKEAEYRLLVRIRDVPQSGYIIGYCDNQTLVYSLTDNLHSETSLRNVLKPALKWSERIQWLMCWLELAMKMHALSPRT